MKAIFLSASVPVPGRGDFYKTSDPLLIHAAVHAFISVCLGRRLIVWGGHPAITPMIWAAAESLGVSYGKAVKLFQSQFFKDDYPEENKYFQNVQYVPAVPGDRLASLKVMREKMFGAFDYAAGVFLGGMEGVFEEHGMFSHQHNGADVILVASTGGATLDLYNKLQLNEPDLLTSLDYIGLFHDKLKISPKERRQTGA